MKCCICGKEISVVMMKDGQPHPGGVLDSHNPQPIFDFDEDRGNACKDCNEKFVIPARFTRPSGQMRLPIMSRQERRNFIRKQKKERVL